FAVLLLTILMSFVVINVARGMNHVNVQEKPISVVLNMADQHQLKSVSLNGDDVNAIGTNGQHYHALKEDGQSVTELFRRDGVSVTVDTGQDVSWVPVLLDVLFVGAAVGLLYFVVRRTGVGGAGAFSR